MTQMGVFTGGTQKNVRPYGFQRPTFQSEIGFYTSDLTGFMINPAFTMHSQSVVALAAAGTITLVTISSLNAMYLTFFSITPGAAGIFVELLADAARFFRGGFVGAQDTLMLPCPYGILLPTGADLVLRNPNAAAASYEVTLWYQTVLLP